MALIRLDSSQIKVEDLSLSFNLTANRDGFPDEKDSFNYTGSKEFNVGMYKDGMAFGITSIEIETSLNMQPQIEITFKDLYGNLVFRPGQGGSESSYSKIFELPPAKFRLTFKGYLGKPITYKLQLRSTSVNYVSSDGSFELKAKFVPNIFGFFGDIPFKFLYASDKLHELRGGSPSPNSMLNIYKNGNAVSESVETASQQYANLEKQLNALIQGPGGGTSITQSASEGLFSSDGKTPYKVDSISPTDSNLSSATPPFKPITFNFTNNSQGPASGTNDSSFYGEAIYYSIKTDTANIGSQGVNTTQAGWSTQVKALSGKNTDIQKLIQDNLAAIKSATQKSAGSQIQTEVLDSQTIGTVMSSMAGTSAFILGYILEGALKGYSDDRRQNKDIIGLYYPLYYKENTTDGTGGQVLYDQVPWDKATVEMKYVQDFMKAQYEGQQQLQKYKEEQEAKQSGVEGAVDQGSELIKRITNAEAFKPNVYVPDNPDNVITKMLQRAGIVNTRMAGQVETDANVAGERNQINTSEYENIKKRITEFRSFDKATLRKFATAVTKFFDATGKRVGDFAGLVETGSTTTYREYFQTYFNKMRQGGMSDEMFDNSNPSSLVCNYFINNGVMYYSEKALYDKVKGNVFFYITSDKAQLTSTVVPNIETSGATSSGATDAGTGSITETLDGAGNDKTAPYQSSFFKFLEKSGLGLASPYSLIVDYNKLTSGSYVPIDDLFIKMSTTAGQDITVPADGSYFARLANLKDATTVKTYVLSFTDTAMMATLYGWCANILKDTAAEDAVLDQQKAAEEKKQAQENGTSTESSPNSEPYTFSQSVYDSVYHQFHHIANAWLSIIEESLGRGVDRMGLASNKKLAEELEKAYTSTTGDAQKPYSISFSYAMQSSTVSNSMLAKAIVNTSLLGETDTESTVFTTMSNVAQQNNFLLQPIPGGLSENKNLGLDVEKIFQPTFENTGLEGTSLCFIWQPTPESRSLNNSGKFLYGDTAPLLAGVGKMEGDFPLFKFGSPDNVFVKSIKATTDDNKVTSESISAVEDIISPNNQSKKRAFDCSMLSVMQGRSYRISLDIMGNANFLPTQRFVIDNIPIFSGLYWTSNVKHSITPNEMTTSIEAMKLKYDGSNKIVGVGPVTTANYKGDAITVTGSDGNNNGSTGTESIHTDGINYPFLQRIKDEKMKNSAEINAFIKKYTNNKYSDYPTWFNSEMAGKYCCSDKSGRPTKIDAKAWTNVWNLIIPTVWSDYGNAGINFLEFLCINMIMYNETGGSYQPITEGVNGITNKPPGIAYAFNAMPLKGGGNKATYNKAANLTALQLFSDPKYVNRFKGLPFGSELANTKDSRWGGDKFPEELFPNNLKEAAALTPSTFINEADFVKFRGRGYIQTTWRGGYKKLLNFIMGYTGSDTKIQEYKAKFGKSPYFGNNDDTLTVSTNADWDDLFKNSPVIQTISMKTHADGAKKYQYFTDLTIPKEKLEEKVPYVAYRVSGAYGEYAERFTVRVYGHLDTLSPDTVQKKPQTNDSGKDNVRKEDAPAGTTDSQIDAIKKALTALYGSTTARKGGKKAAGEGEKGLCGVYTVTAAKNYSELLKDPNKKLTLGAYVGGNAKDKVNRDTLESYGYKLFFVGSAISKKDLADKLEKAQWGIGDVAIYWALSTAEGGDGNSKDESSCQYGHIQIFQGKQYNGYPFATSTTDNYKCTFVYGGSNYSKWNLYICRAPASSSPPNA